MGRELGCFDAFGSTGTSIGGKTSLQDIGREATTGGGHTPCLMSGSNARLLLQAGYSIPKSFAINSTPFLVFKLVQQLAFGMNLLPTGLHNLMVVANPFCGQSVKFGLFEPFKHGFALMR